MHYQLHNVTFYFDKLNAFFYIKLSSHPLKVDRKIKNKRFQLQIFSSFGSQVTDIFCLFNKAEEVQTR